MINIGAEIQPVLVLLPLVASLLGLLDWQGLQDVLRVLRVGLQLQVRPLALLGGHLAQAQGGQSGQGGRQPPNSILLASFH